jgi:hypothetical protein
VQRNPGGNLHIRRFGVRVSPRASRAGVVQQGGHLVDQAFDLAPRSPAVLEQRGPRGFHVATVTALSCTGGAHAIQGVGELAAGLVHVRQTLEAFGENYVHSMALGSLNRIGEQGQRRFVATFGEVHPGGQCQPQPADRTSRRGAHWTAQQWPHLLHRGVAFVPVQHGQHDLQHQPRPDLAAVVLGIGQTGQQLETCPGMRLGLCSGATSTVARRVGSPRGGSQQQCCVAVEGGVLPVELVGLIERRREQVAPAERVRRLGCGDECSTPQHRGDIVACG